VPQQRGGPGLRAPDLDDTGSLATGAHLDGPADPDET
jgi:hypothetical protein